ncbi:MAG: (Fe-S)-binding protein [Alphaproteobacteria bacterium]|nr:(Fe-S)-binding protein [Alphaproteobacteria bacterium]
MSAAPQRRPRVGLFVTCLVDLFRPTVGFAAVKLLEDAGCEVEVPGMQTCCGQPAFNAGDNDDARMLARRTIALLEDYDYVVVPSGSCGGMIREHYPELLAGDADWAPRARHVAARTHELVSFLHDVRGVTRVDARYADDVTYHDSCSGLRELGVKTQPRALLRSVDGVALKELPGAETCCGFGGTFCVKYPEISDKMVGEKAADILATGAGTLLAGDMGCLMNMAGKLKRLAMETGARQVKVRHVAEVLAGMTDEAAPIGEPEAKG